MAYDVSVPAATAIVGNDLFANTFWKTSGRRRMIRALGFLGSAAAGDCQADLMVGEVTYANPINITTGFPTKDHMFPSGNIPIPPGTPVSLIVRDAAATNPINAKIDIAG